MFTYIWSEVFSDRDASLQQLPAKAFNLWSLINDCCVQWRAQASGGAGAKWRCEGTIVGSPGSLWLGVSRFTVLSRFFEHYSQTNFPIIKTKPYKVAKYIYIYIYIKYGRYLGKSGRRYKSLSLFYLCFKKLEQRHTLQIHIIYK